MWQLPGSGENYMFKISQEEAPGVFHKQLMRHFPLQWQVGVIQGETFDTNSNEYKNAPNPEVLIFDITEAISILSLQTN